jgi:DNA-binding GntR family transcriptional regulator
MSKFEKLANASLLERITLKIKEAILTGQLREGDRVVERSLAAQFETSVTAVREALVQLETEGFVVKTTNSATHVTKFSVEAVDQIYQVRKVLETFAVEEATRLATDEQIRALEQGYLALLDTARAQKVQEFVLKDIALHEMIWQLAANEYLEIALKRVVYPIFAFTAIRLVSLAPFDLLQDAYSHLPIIEAVKSRNPETAKRAFIAALDHWAREQERHLFLPSEKKERTASAMNGEIRQSMDKHDSETNLPLVTP